MLMLVVVVTILCLSNLSLSSNTGTPQCLTIKSDERLDCHPETKATLERCQERGCCWSDNASNGGPQCFFPSDYNGYNVTLLYQKSNEVSLRLRRNIPSGLPNDIQDVLVTVYGLTERVARVRIIDVDQSRVEHSFPTLNIPRSPMGSLKYGFAVNGSKLVIFRQSTRQPVFQTDLKQLIFARLFIQLSTLLPSRYVYGLGEHKAPFRKTANWTTYTLWNRDTMPTDGISLYGSHPFHLTVDDDHGHASGIFLHNTHAMDVVLTPGPAIVYRPIGGIIDMYVFIGESPEKVVNDYINLIGHPALPPLWSLGFHICRYGQDYLNETKAVWLRNRKAGIPYEAVWNDIEYMEKFNDFSYDKIKYGDLPSFVQELHKVGMRYVAILDPGISGSEPLGTHKPYDEGLKANIFIKNASDQILVGRVWNWGGKTVFPDFTHPNATDYWTRMVKDLYAQVEFDGLWIDMNEPANFVHGSIDGCPADIPYENPPYVPGGQMLRKNTICMSAKQHAGLHYSLHNLYGTYETHATYSSLEKVRPGKRPFVISRATSPGSGRWGAHWSGDVESTWDILRYSLGVAMEFNMFGIPMIGTDICGFYLDTTEELCARWMTVGAFYPFSRNHNGKGNKDQDPAAMGPVVLKASRFALNLRYQLLPYLYTLFFEANQMGSTVVRPLFFNFPNDLQARAIEYQFMWGDGLMVIPVVEEGATAVNGYLPKGIWYFVDTYSNVTSSGQFHNFQTPLEYINVLIRGGTIIPAAEGSLRVTDDLQNAPFKLIVAFDEKQTASGQLYWDDGESVGGDFNFIEFKVENNTLKSTPKVHRLDASKSLSKLEIVGHRTTPTRVTLNGTTTEFNFDNARNLLTIVLKDRVELFAPFVISWS